MSDSDHLLVAGSAEVKKILSKAGFLAMLPAAIGKSLRATSPCLQVNISLQDPEKKLPKAAVIAKIAVLSCTHKSISQGWRSVICTGKVCRRTIQRAFSTTHACRDAVEYTKVINPFMLQLCLPVSPTSRLEHKCKQARDTVRYNAWLGDSP